jgi:AcrR family transcriptional regulator
LTKTAEPARQRQKRGLDVPVARQRRAQIVTAAKACISEDGIDRLTLRGVAERAEVSHATIAYYFHTRQELIDAALLEASEEFMGVLMQRELQYGPQDLDDLVETFLDGTNPSARFVVQMIDAGLHDLKLRDTHAEFVQYGRERIEKSISVGIDRGTYRSDIDSRLAAALVHTILIWWESELAANATTRDLALEVGRLTLRLMKHPEVEASPVSTPIKRQHGGNGNERFLTIPQATGMALPDLLDASLFNDPMLSPEAAQTLAQSFKAIYWLAVAAPKPAATNGAAGLHP